MRFNYLFALLALGGVAIAAPVAAEAGACFPIYQHLYDTHLTAGVIQKLHLLRAALARGADLELATAVVLVVAAASVPVPVVVAALAMAVVKEAVLASALVSALVAVLVVASVLELAKAVAVEMAGVVALDSEPEREAVRCNPWRYLKGQIDGGDDIQYQ